MTTYTGHLVIRLSNGKAQNVFQEDGSLVQPTGTYELDLVQSFTDAAWKSPKTAKDDKALIKEVLEANGGTQFYRFRLTAEGITDDYTTDCPVYPDKEAGAKNKKEWGKRQYYDMSLLKYVLEHRGQDLTKVERMAGWETVEKPQQREEAGPVTRIPANAGTLQVLTKLLATGELSPEQYGKAVSALEN
jgi:hypothetical protein